MNNTNNTKKMENNNKKNAREFMLLLCEVGESMSAFAYALEMAKALKNDEITIKQFELLSGDLKLHCLRNKIETSNEICSLF